MSDIDVFALELHSLLLLVYLSDTSPRSLFRILTPVLFCASVTSSSPVTVNGRIAQTIALLKRARLGGGGQTCNQPLSAIIIRNLPFNLRVHSLRRSHRNRRRRCASACASRRRLASLRRLHANMFMVMLYGKWENMLCGRIAIYGVYGVGVGVYLSYVHMYSSVM